MRLGSKYSVKLALMAVLLCAAAPVLAQQKIAVIDVARIMTESKRGQEVLTQLEKLQADKRADLQVLNDEVVALQKRYQEGRLSLAQDKLEELESEIETKGRAFERAREDAELAVQKMRDQDIKGVEDAVLPIISVVGTELGYTLIFNKFQSGLVFASDAVDITDLVLQRFDESEGNE